MALTEWASRIVKAAIPMTDIPSGPWRGAMESRPADRIPREYAAGVGSTNFLYLPRSGTWKRRGGQEIRFDTFGSQVGLLPAKWLSSSTSTYCKARQMEEFSGDLATDGIPTVMALVTKETVESGLDDGFFSNVYVRDQVNSTHYTLGSEYSSLTYAALGSQQYLLNTPLWYESGDGGITRGTTEFLRRFLVSGSRRFLKVGNWWYYPSLRGTPARWNGTQAVNALVTRTPSSDITPVDTEWGRNGGDGGGPPPFTTTWEQVNTNDSSTSYINLSSSIVGTYNYQMGMSGAITPAAALTVNFYAKSLFSLTIPPGVFTVKFFVYDSAGTSYETSSITGDQLGTDWQLFTLTAYPLGGSASTANSIKISGAVLTNPPTYYFAVTYMEVTQGSGTPAYGRLIPSGPLPPTHAGSLAAANLTSSIDSTFAYPDGDVSDGAWTGQDAGTSLSTYIDETTVNDADYIETANGGNTSCEVTLGNLGFTPIAADAVRVFFRVARGTAGAGGNVTFNVQLLEASTIIAQQTYPNGGGISTTFDNFDFTLNSTEIGAITDWNDLRLKFTTSAAAASGKIKISWAYLKHTPSGGSEGVWTGHDRFFYSVAYRFEDGSVWAPCTPRLPSDVLTDGYNMFTVDGSNLDATYSLVRWSNLPIGPHGVVSRILLRTPKVNASSAGNALDLSQYGFRVVAEITDNTTTTYEDFQSDDTGPYDDAAGLFIRYDQIMPPRARYIAGGDMRIVHAYGGQNPCAIQVAPVGRSADYDLNLLDSSSTAYTSNGSYMRVRFESDGTKFLDLIQSDAASATDTINASLATYDTLQKLVDYINSTSCSVNGQQWRAQLCPGVNPAAPSATCLTPHTREIASVVTTSSSRNITKAAGGLSVVAVGDYVSGTGIAAGAYIDRIDSDTQLRMSANATASGTVELTFFKNTGDTGTTGVTSYQRVIANSLPGFLYFAESYLDDDPVDKSSVWMTTATPGSMRSAANNFSGKPANRFKPPTNAGISMGGAAVDQGFVLPFSGGVFALRNESGSNSGTGVDEDYKLVELNANRGCIAWNTVTPGNRFVPYLTAEGMCAADLEQEFLISDELWLHSPSTGNLSYEIPLCIAATAKDDDTAYASCKVMRSAVWLNYRTSASTTHPNSQAVLDFSTGYVSNGLGALFSKPGDVWGWSTRLVRSVTAMCEGRRSDGGHLYGWNELNAGSTGGGRIDEIEYGDTDNTTAISAAIIFPWERMGQHFKLSAQEIILEHSAPSGATVLLDFHRSYSDTTYTLTPSTTALVVGREVKFLPQAARVPTAACYIGYRQTAGGAAELRAFTLRAKSIPSYT